MEASGIGKLIHLRYLSLEDAEVSHLPSSLGNLALPIDMERKRKLDLSNQVNLETLINFSTKNSSLEDLCGMVRLRTLEIILTQETSMETISASIGGLQYLENLKIYNKGRIEKDMVLDIDNIIKELRLYHMQMTSLPKEHFPSRLRTLELSFCRLEEDPMPILEKLLMLKEVYLWIEVFIGRRMVCSGGGFPQLHKLFLVGLEEWEEWIIEEGSMPLLHSLSIINCPKLKELPDGLRFLHSLKDLAVDKKWKERLSEGGADHDKVQHIPSVNCF